MGLNGILSKTKHGIVRVAGPLGLYAIAWRLTRHRPRIFMYHRFAAQDSGHCLGRGTFRDQLRLLKKHCRVVTMGELAEVLRHEPASAAGLAVVTVDDGYRDFHDHAWPVLLEEGVSATFFPVTDFIDGETWLWPDLVEHALAQAREREVTAADLGLTGDGTWSLLDPVEIRAAWQALIDHAIDLPDSDKWAFLHSLYHRLGLAWPTEPPDHYAPVTWDLLNQMAESGIEIGAHTRTHCRLTRVGEDQLADELEGARTRLEKKLGRPVVSLCYPNGAPADYDTRVMRAAERAGYRSAVAAYFDGEQGGLYDLRRHGAGTDQEQFRKHLCGVEDLSRRLQGKPTAQPGSVEAL